MGRLEVEVAEKVKQSSRRKKPWQKKSERGQMSTRLNRLIRGTGHSLPVPRGDGSSDDQSKDASLDHVQGKGDGTTTPNHEYEAKVG